uniref:HIG1 domain-containing protein n=1 Tax=Setaria digitata TaxID=48799 RepID=A0A915PLA7_9BILA
MSRFSAKRMFAIWIWPVFAATLIISDWRTMANLRAEGHATVLDAMRDEKPVATKAIWERKTLWASAAVMAYLGYCYDQQGMYKASMMKGKSKMFADRIAEIPEGQDIWKY